MKCDTCQTKNFVHASTYCQGCKSKPTGKIKSGMVYLFLKNGYKPLISAEVEAPENDFHNVAASELLKKLRIEYIDSNATE